MKSCPLIVLFLMLSHAMVAQTPSAGYISGTVLLNNLPSAGTTVLLKGFPEVFKTDSDGHFKIPSPTGRQVIRIGQGAGIYLERVVEVVAGTTTIVPDILLAGTAQQVEEVVITGQHTPQSLRNSVYQVRVINSEKIRLRAPGNIQQVLNTELGFHFSNDLTLGTSDVQLMGMSGRNVKILLDGVPMIDRSDTRESLNQIDINSVERIEIVEGPMSVAYGSDALAGVINVITKKTPEDTFQLTARLQEESAGNEYSALDGKGSHNQHVGFAFQKDGLSVLGGFTRNSFGGWKIGPPTATVLAAGQWLPKAQWLTNAKIGYRKSGYNLWYRIDVADETLDSKGAMNPNNYKARFAQYNTDRYTHQLQGEWNASNKLTVNGVLGYSSLKRATRTVIHDFIHNVDELTQGPGEQDIARFSSTIFRGTLQYKATPTLSLQPGMELNVDGADGARIKGTPSINDYALFVTAEWQVTPDISLKPGIRTVWNSVYDAPPVIPSVNAKFKLAENLGARLGYASGFRAPALRELFYDFFDASHSITGNPDLKAERSDSFTGSLVYTHSGNIHFKNTLSGFYNNFRNRIDYGQSAEDASITTLININRFKTTGATLENSILWENINVSLGISYIGRYNQYSEDTLKWSDLPAFVWSPEVNSNLMYSFPKIGTDLSISYKFTGSKPVYELITIQDTQQPRLVRTGSFSMADMMIHKKIFSYLNLNAGVKNIFDVTSLNSTTTMGEGTHNISGNTVPLSYGRSYVLGLTFNWNRH